MGAILLIAMILIVPKSTVIAVIYGLALIPFTYFIDRMAYRNYLRRNPKS